MKSFLSAIVLASTISGYPFSSEATVELPSYQCTYSEPSGGAPSSVDCQVPSQSSPTTVAGAPAVSAKYEELRKSGFLHIIYTKNEIENAHTQINQKITDLTTQANHLRVGLDATNASVSNKLGNAAEKAIKENLASTLDYLIRQDPEFRQLLKRLLQEK